MAAPIEDETKTPASDKIPEFLDPSSPKFDPKRALYHSQTPVLVPDAKQFNNLAEFENYLEGKDAKTLKEKKPKPKEKLPGIIAVRAAAQAKENVRKAAIMAKNAGPSERTKTQERRNRSTTVFTKMESYKKGPLSVLRKCVQERLRVIVVVRAAVAVRSRCRGYVIGFDKHFNMALMDVDEKFIRPVPQKLKKTKCKKDTGSQESLLAGEADKLSVKAEDTRDDIVDKNSESRQVDPRKSDVQVDLREKLKSSKTSGRKNSSNKVDSSKTGSDESSFKETTSRNSDSKDRLEKSGTKEGRKSAKETSGQRSRSKETQSLRTGSMKEEICSRPQKGQGNMSSDDSFDQRSTDDNLERSKDKRSRDYKDHYRNYMSDSNVFVKRQQERLKDKGSKSDGESRSESRDRQKKADKVIKKSFEPFWPLYKKWTENRCYSEYEIVTRHVNQLFIRGDNVVSVSIAEY